MAAFYKTYIEPQKESKVHDVADVMVDAFGQAHPEEWISGTDKQPPYSSGRRCSGTITIRSSNGLRKDQRMPMW